MPSKEYTQEEMHRMQREAVDRVREMQKKARARLENGGSPYPNKVPQLSPPVPPSVSAPAAAPKAEAPPTPFGALSLIAGKSPLTALIGDDPDRLTILLLMLILSADGRCSPSLMAALFWLMTE